MGVARISHNSFQEWTGVGINSSAHSSVLFSWGTHDSRLVISRNEFLYILVFHTLLYQVRVSDLNPLRTWLFILGVSLASLLKLSCHLKHFWQTREHNTHIRSFMSCSFKWTSLKRRKWRPESLRKKERKCHLCFACGQPINCQSALKIFHWSGICTQAPGLNVIFVCLSWSWSWFLILVCGSNLAVKGTLLKVTLHKLQFT